MFLKEVWKDKHPAVFPVEIPKRCIEAFTTEGDTVRDPFMGSGTVGVACKILNRNFIGIDIDTYYCALAKERIKGTKYGVDLKIYPESVKEK